MGYGNVSACIEMKKFSLVCRLIVKVIYKHSLLAYFVFGLIFVPWTALVGSSAEYVHGVGPSRS